MAKAYQYPTEKILVRADGVQITELRIDWRTGRATIIGRLLDVQGTEIVPVGTYSVEFAASLLDSLHLLPGNTILDKLHNGLSTVDVNVPSGGTVVNI